VSSLKAKVRLAAVAPQSAVVVLEDNTIWYKGTSVDYHFPNNESKGSFAQLKLWADQTAEEKIVDITSGYGYTLAVTENGALWAWGKRFLDAIDQTSKDPIELKLPQGTLCRRAWAPGGPDSESSACAFVELEECKTGKKHIYSAGKSEKGMLGQGDRVKESREFNKIFYESDDLVYTTLSVGNESAMAIDSAG
jgi:alpha-tubulin suppressor-like RCC1 family protein